MIQLTDEEMKKAYFKWSRNNYFVNCDERLKPFVNCNFSDSWLKSAREALLMSPGAVADKMGLSRESYINLEKREDLKSITLDSLMKAAEAMDCEFVYAIRPKSRKLFSEIIWEKIWPDAIQNVWIKNCDPENRHGALAFLVRKKLKEAKFRAKMGWSQRANTASGREY